MSKPTRREFVQAAGGLLAASASLPRAPAGAADREADEALPPQRGFRLEGVHLYTDRISTAAGESIRIHTSAAVPYDLEIVRLGRHVDSADDDEILHAWRVDHPVAQPIRPGSHLHVARSLPVAACPEFSAECWLRLWNLSEPQGVISQLDDGAGFGLLVLPGGEVAFFTGESGTPAETTHRTRARLSKPGPAVSGVIPPANWHHVAAVFERGRKTVWLDGRLVGDWSTAEPLVPADCPLRIGAFGVAGQADGLLDADIAQPAIHSCALSADEIRNRFVDRGRHVPSSPSLIGCWPLDEERGRRVRDIGPIQRHGLIVNHATWMIGGPSFLPAVARYGAYNPDADPRRGHALRLASDDLYDCRWPATQEFRIPAASPSGLYTVRARFQADDGPRVAHATFVVKKNAGASKAPIALLFSTNTWKAYSATPFCRAWPAGASVSTQGHRVEAGDRHAAYSCYRHHRAGQPAYQFGWRMPWPIAAPDVRYLQAELGYSHLARADRHTQTWLQRENYRHDSYSDLDLHRDSQLLNGYQVLFIVGHSEYWSREAAAQVRAFLDRGGSVVCLSGNTMYWRVSFDSGAEVMECRKVDAWGAQLLPQMRGECWHEHDHLRGGVPRDDGDPAWRTLGTEFAMNNLLGAAGVGPFRVTGDDHFLFHQPRELSMRAGDEFGADPRNPLRQPIGHESDARVSLVMQLAQQPPPPGAPTGLQDPAGITLLAEGIALPGAKLSARDYYHRITTPHQRNGKQIACEMIYWQRPGGGRVFSAPSIAAGWTLSVDERWSGLLKNVLHHFGVAAET
jgi:hypothetical protein